MPLTLAEVKDLIQYCKEKKVSRLMFEGLDFQLHAQAFIDKVTPFDPQSRIVEPPKPSGDDTLLFHSAD